MNSKKLLIPIEETINKSYYIYFSDRIEEEYINNILEKRYSRFVIITDNNVYRIYKNTIDDLADRLGKTKVIVRPAGEEYKHISYTKEIYEELLLSRIDRKSCIIALGGGVTGDFAGFIAATYQRGIDFIQIPTTLLAMVDSSVGGKVAVNIDIGKNIVGAFYQPVMVICDISFLQTLDEREWICGLAEMVKHSLLDKKVYHNFKNTVFQYPDYRSWDRDLWLQLIYESVQVKASIVAVDEKETGLRSVLNLGHTVGHAIESFTNYKVFSHGEAVSRGLVFSLLLSSRTLSFPEEKVREILEIMKVLKLPLDTGGIEGKELIPHLFFDKKNQENKIKEIYLQDIGKPVYNRDLNLEDFLEIWNLQKSLFG